MILVRHINANGISVRVSSRLHSPRSGCGWNRRRPPDNHERHRADGRAVTRPVATGCRFGRTTCRDGRATGFAVNGFSDGLVGVVGRRTRSLPSSAGETRETAALRAETSTDARGETPPRPFSAPFPRNPIRTSTTRTRQTQHYVVKRTSIYT